MRKSGFTIIETMLGMAILVIIAIAMVKLLKPNIAFFQRFEARQQANFDARKCLDTIRRLLSNGKSSTVVITTPTNGPPNSWIGFQGVDGSSSTIRWSNSPPNTVHVLHSVKGDTNYTDTVVATNVSGLMFTLDFRDPNIINVALQLDMPLDRSGQATSVYTLLQPNQSIRMVTSQ
jgi:type II secretory pathway pseudopilin PulG